MGRRAGRGRGAQGSAAGGVGEQKRGYVSHAEGVGAWQQAESEVGAHSSAQQVLAASPPPHRRHLPNPSTPPHAPCAPSP